MVVERTIRAARDAGEGQDRRGQLFADGDTHVMGAFVVNLGYRF